MPLTRTARTSLAPTNKSQPLTYQAALFFPVAVSISFGPMPAPIGFTSPTEEMQKSARQRRPDELAYDPKDQIILIANPDEASAKPTPGVPFISFISTATVTPCILGKVIYDGNTTDGPAATGIEQPVWDGLTGKFYLTIPGTSTRPKGEIDEIDPTTRVITRSFATTCTPAGLALIPGQRLITSCGDIVKISDLRQRRI